MRREFAEARRRLEVKYEQQQDQFIDRKLELWRQMNQQDETNEENRKKIEGVRREVYVRI